MYKPFSETLYLCSWQCVRPYIECLSSCMMVMQFKTVHYCPEKCMRRSWLLAEVLDDWNHDFLFVALSRGFKSGCGISFHFSHLSAICPPNAKSRFTCDYAGRSMDHKMSVRGGGGGVVSICHKLLSWTLVNSQSSVKIQHTIKPTLLRVYVAISPSLFHDPWVAGITFSFGRSRSRGGKEDVFGRHIASYGNHSISWFIYLLPYSHCGINTLLFADTLYVPTPHFGTGGIYPSHGKLIEPPLDLRASFTWHIPRLSHCFSGWEKKA